MPQIHSVRQPIKAPQQNILGGAMQGFAGFANNMANENIRKKEQEVDQQEQQSKYVANLLSTLAQKGIIAEGPNTPTWYKELGLKERPKEVDWTKKKAQITGTLAGMKGGLLETTPNVQAATDKAKYDKVLGDVNKKLLFNSPEATKLMASGTSEDMAKWQALRERELNAQLGKSIRPSDPAADEGGIKTPSRGILNNVFNNPALDFAGKNKIKNSKVIPQKNLAIDTKAAKWLTDNGAPVTEANIKAVIKQGKVK